MHRRGRVGRVVIKNADGSQTIRERGRKTRHIPAPAQPTATPRETDAAPSAGHLCHVLIRSDAGSYACPYCKARYTVKKKATESRRPEPGTGLGLDLT
ncbi:predicted protein [Streptomyces viridochromogenes DSM 40736]|uniref:Predicted protein n=1 Tax=Streptomyces viridochromogenes (strain DSM 40736 / JCM 4977 / BCRC 1201 / Tue 494) TaxID=591159 RepID=D9XH27_STRVT|nr:predicted protein [Streptomyces viridochromogenes DSM 40736]